MLEFYKRHGRAFLTIGTGFLISGIQVLCFLGEHEYQRVVIAVLFTLGVVFFVFGGRAVLYDYKDSRQKDEEQKRVEVRKALREAVKRLNPEYTEEQIDWWIDNK